MEETNPVIDNGSGVLKAGFAGGDKPEVTFASAVGTLKYKHSRVIMSPEVEGIDHFIGNKLNDHRGILKVHYPMDHGVVQNWDHMERVWDHVYSKECLSLKSSEHPVLITEAPLNPTANRKEIAKVFFEKFNVPAIFIAPQAILSLYASGRTTGMVCDCGDGVTHVVPVYEGYALANAVTRSNVAGRDVTDRLQLLLRRAGCNLLTSSEKEIVREVKEKSCYVAFNPRTEEDTFKTQDYLLPDGEVVSLGREMFRAPEVLFRPDVTGSEELGVHECVHRSLMLCDRDLRATMYKQLVLAGGSTMFRGFGDRLLNEIRMTAPENMKITISAPPQRKYSTWVGGSILAALSTFTSLWVTRSQWNDMGETCLDNMGM